jgi:hypothetical protein
MYLTLGGGKLRLGLRNLILGEVSSTPATQGGGGYRPQFWQLQRPLQDDRRAEMLIRQNNAALLAVLI